ncbi:MAG TPA: peptidylprolyl isomerase [Vicinamibacterales bacterium]|nr:peptidylprolyl isomerase [Vicinamibacterales bacterium]
MTNGMRRLARVLVFVLGASAVGSHMAADQAGALAVLVVIETEKGRIDLAVDRVRAPLTAENFLKYVDAGAYDGGQFQRTVRPDTETNTTTPIQVVQARRGRGTAGFGPIALERTSMTGLSHRDGVVSMARGPAPDSASSDFFICIGDQPSLDHGGARNPDGQGFAAFGRVVAGMDVVRAIQASPVQTGTQTLAPPIRIVRVARKAP